MGLFDWLRGRPAPARASRLDSGTALIPAPETSSNWVERFDAWSSALTGFGDPNLDKRQSVGFVTDLVDWATAQGLWRGDDMAKRIIEKPAKAMYRKAFECKIQDKDQSEAVAHEHKRLQSFSKCKTAKMYEAAYGGGAIHPVLNDGAEDLSEPLNEGRIVEIKSLQVYEPRELQPARWYRDPNDDKYGEPEVYRVIPITPAGAVYGSPIQEIHESRLITWPGFRVTRQQQWGTLYGWGDSKLTAVNSVLRDYGIGWSSAAVLLHDFSQAVYKKVGLAKGLSQTSKAEFQAAMSAIELGRSTIRATVIDSTETYERIQTPINGLSDLLREFGVRLAAAADMPVVVLMGISSAGLNATGESDVRLWYDSISEAQIDETPRMERLNELIMLQRGGPMRGSLPKVWSVQWCPLWQQSDKEKVDARKVQADIDVAYINVGVISAEEVALARFGGDEYSFDTHIDIKEREALEPAAPPPVRAQLPPSQEETLGGLPPGEEPPPDDEEIDPEAGDLPNEEAADEEDADDGPSRTAAREDDAGWDEGQHPRAADGKFGEGSSVGELRSAIAQHDEVKADTAAWHDKKSELHKELSRRAGLSPAERKAHGVLAGVSKGKAVELRSASTAAPSPAVATAASTAREITSPTEARQWEQRSFGQWHSSWSKDERDALKNYAGSRYKSINDSLRGLSKKGTEQWYVKDDIKQLDSAMSRAKTPEAIVVYRGGPAMPKIRVGSTFTDKGYGSTSLLKSKAAEFSEGTLFEIKVPKGSRAGGLKNDVEHEILIDRGGKYKVTGVRQEKGHKVVSVELSH